MDGLDGADALLYAWMPRQRWFGGKGHAPQLRVVTAWDLPTDTPDLQARTYLVADDSARTPALYQVPVVARPDTADVATEHVIGVPGPGRVMIDAAYDPAYTRILYDQLVAGDRAASPTPSPSRVLAGEQSNTSIIYTGSDPPIIAKLYRQLHPGTNPDIELQSALSAAGCRHVPPVIGSVEGTWPSPDTESGRVEHGSLVFAQEFLPGVEDAWRVALRAAAADTDFSSRAVELGATTASVHRSLAELFPTRAATDADRTTTRAIWQRRLQIAIAEVPGVSDVRQAIEAVYARAVEQPWPHLQRIHGDYHLGQVILVPERGWMLLDFEGEPMRPMHERLLPDLAPRDVAGMLRSFDYVAGSLILDGTTRSPERVRDWARSARAAFLTGYAGDAPEPVAGDLVTALELDKAVYEAIYEARNRPTWTPIPLLAIQRLTTR